MTKQNTDEAGEQTPMDRLMELLREAFKEKSLERIKRYARAMGPHVNTLRRAMDHGKRSGTSIVAVSQANGAAGVEAIAIMDVELAADVASELHIGTDQIALHIEESMRRADAKGDADVVERIARWLLENPECGFVCTDENPPTTWRPISTWRLKTTRPEAADAWEECATTFMRNARMRRPPR